MMRLAFVVAALWLALLPAAAQQLPLKDPAKVSSEFTLAQIEAILMDSGLSFLRETSSSGTPVFIITTDAGGKFVMGLTVCEPGGDNCLGLHLFAIFDMPGGGDPLALINAFEGQVPFAKAFITRRGRPVIARYVIADGGITNANIFFNMTNFLGTAERFLSLVQGDGTGTPGASFSRSLSAHASTKDLAAMADGLEAKHANTKAASFGLPKR